MSGLQTPRGSWWVFLPLLLLSGCGKGDNQPVQHQVTTEASGGGHLTPNEVIVQDRETTSFKVRARPGYRLQTIQGCSGTLYASTYTTGRVTSDCSVQAVFAPIKAPR